VADEAGADSDCEAEGWDDGDDEALVGLVGSEVVGAEVAVDAVADGVVTSTSPQASLTLFWKSLSATAMVDCCCIKAVKAR
jgi:hypothetical protein